MIAATVILAANLYSPGEYGKAMGDGLSELEPGGGPVAALNNVCPGDVTLTGIDVSYYQDTVDWNAVAADGVTFALIRVSHSLQFFDPEFDTNWANARAAGVHSGVYQYFEPDEDPIAQADLLLDAMGPLMPGDLPPVIDVESTAGMSGPQIGAAVQAWVDHVESELGVKPIIYTGPYFWQDNVGSDAFGEYPLWIAHYGTNCPLTPTPWEVWNVHQFTDSGSVNGVPGNVDTNTFNGDLDDLLALGTDQVPICGTLTADGGVIDNGDDCLRLLGNSEFWRDESIGEGGSLVWTNATDNADPSNSAIWQLWFDEVGEYEVEVYIEEGFAETTQAAYVIEHAGGSETVTIDQSAESGWVSLGTFEFDGETRYDVRLDDNTGEPNDGEFAIVVDALRVTGMGVAGGSDDESDGGSDDAADDSGGGNNGGDTGGDDDSDDDGEDDVAGTGDGTDGETFNPALPPAASGDDGCGCTTNRDAPSWALFFLVAGLIRRRGATSGSARVRGPRED